MRLDIGSGNFPKEGFTTIDKYTQAHFYGDITKLFYKDNSIEEVYTNQVLEHLSKKEVPVALKEIQRILQPNGKFTIIVPDLEYCVNYWLKDKQSRGFPLDVIYGNQEHEGEFHKTGFTMETLKTLVEQAGLKITRIEIIDDHAVKSIIVEGVK